MSEEVVNKFRVRFPPLPKPKPKPKPKKLKTTKVVYDSDVIAVYERCVNTNGKKRYKQYKAVFDFFENEQPLKSLHRKINASKSSVHDIIETLQKAGLITVYTKIENNEVIEKFKMEFR